jgi:hypothetical protein
MFINKSQTKLINKLKQIKSWKVDKIIQIMKTRVENDEHKVKFTYFS